MLNVQFLAKCVNLLGFQNLEGLRQVVGFAPRPRSQVALGNAARTRIAIIPRVRREDVAHPALARTRIGRHCPRVRREDVAHPTLVLFWIIHSKRALL